MLARTAGHAARLGIDPERIAVAGHSAGANLAAAVALRARDQQEPPIRCQAGAAWRHYLDSAPATPYAAPTRAEDLPGLPAAYIGTAEFDPNRDEDIAYALRLLQAGVSVELHQWPGTFHSSPALLCADVSQLRVAETGAAPRRALDG